MVVNESWWWIGWLIDTYNKGGWVMEDMEIDHAVNPTVQDHRLT